MSDYLIYGATGYTGALIAREAVRRGQRPILAGRDATAVAALANELALPHRVFALDNLAAVQAGLDQVKLVLHCAGPFSRTSKPMVEGCLAKQVDYLDVTGEIGVFEAVAKQNTAALARGVMLLPGVGFDVVPTDCLALHLKNRLPTATRLALGFSVSGPLSRGTATTMVENLPNGGAVRRNGKIERVPACWKTRTINFGRGPRIAMTIPWGDVSTAYYSTAIPNIEVYMAAPWSMRLFSRLSRFFGWLLGTRWVQNYLKRKVRSKPAGPTEEQRLKGRSLIWGEASDETGQRVTCRLVGPEGYTLTALTALAAVEQVLAGRREPGFQTPAKVFGADFITTIPGIERRDEF